MLSKSLIQFSVDGLGCVPSCCLTWVQTTVEVMKIMVNSFKRSHACTATLRAPDPAAGHHWPTPPPETPGHSRASLGQSFVGSLLLSPGSRCAQGFVWALQMSLVGTGFDSNCDFAPPTILLGVLLCPWTWGIFLCSHPKKGASLIAQLVKNPHAVQETPVWSLGWEDLLEKG